MSRQIVTSYPALVGAVLASIRKKRGLKQAEVAECLGLAVSSCSRIENGLSALSVEQLSRLSERLGVLPSEVLQRADAARVRAQGMGMLVEHAQLPQAEADDKGLILLGDSIRALVRGPGSGRRPDCC